MPTEVIMGTGVRISNQGLVGKPSHNHTWQDELALLSWIGQVKLLISLMINTSVLLQVNARHIQEHTIGRIKQVSTITSSFSSTSNSISYQLYS